MAANNTKMNISYTIKAIDKFTKTHARLTKQLSQIETQLDRVAGNHTINIDADTVVAERQIERVDNQVDKLPRRKVITIIADIDKNFRQSMNRISDFSRDMGEIGMSSGMSAVFTMLAPTLMVAAGGLGAVVSAAGAASVGLAGLAAVAVPALTSFADKYKDLSDAREDMAAAKTEEEIAKATEKLAEAQSQFSSAQLESVKALDQFNKFFDEFSARLEQPVLDIFNRSLVTAQNLLTILEPAIQSSATAVSNLLDAFNQNLNAEDMKAFFDWVNTTAGPNIEKLVSAVGNFVAGFANMLVAFDPLAQQFMDGFLKMSEGFREWTAGLSENTAFQDFITFVSENGPTVLTFFGTLATFLWNLITAMAPVSIYVMELTNRFLQWFNGMMEGSPLIQMIVGGLLTLIGVLGAVLAPIMMVVSVFKSVFGPALSVVGGWITKLVGIFKGQLISILGKVGGAMLRLIGGPWGLLIQAVILLATIVISNWDSIWKWTKDTFSKVGDFLSDTWSDIKSFFSETLRGMAADLGRNFAEMFSSVVQWMGQILSNIKSKWNEVKSFLAGINLYDMGANIIRGLVNGIKSMAGNLVSAAKGVVGDAISAAKSLLQINSPSKLFFEFGEFVDKGFINGMLSMTRKVNSASEKMVSASVPNQPAYGKAFTNAQPQHVDTSASKNQVDVSVNVASTPIIIDKRVLGEVVYETIAELTSAREYRARRFGGEPLV